MFALVALENWYITGLDVKTAFLYGKLNEEIYMKQSTLHSPTNSGWIPVIPTRIPGIPGFWWTFFCI